MKEALKDCIDKVPGWHAIIEHPHHSREWIIDVLAESNDFTTRVAFEVQLSSQTPDKYFARSQRYFDSGIFPVWLVPRQLEFHPTKVPVVVTGFGKTSVLPKDVSELRALPAGQDFVHARDNLGHFVTSLLGRGPFWTAGTPEYQAALQKAAAEKEAARADAERKRLEAIERDIAEMNDRAASPQAAFGQHLIRTQTDTYVWGSLTCCWNCEEPMLVWDTRIGAMGRYSGAPGLRVKSEVGIKRWENHPEVHRAVDNSIQVAKSDIPKAAIKPRRTKARGQLYSAFVCPSCDSTMGQFFVSQNRSEKWSILSSPSGKSTAPTPILTTTPASVRAKAPVPAPTPPIRPGITPGAVRPLKCGLHATPRNW